MKRLSASCTCLALLCVSLAAQALAVSGIEVRSRLNQPLAAEVRLLSATKDELDNLHVAVVSNDTGGSYFSFRPEIVQDDQGSLIRISTDQPVREPILLLRVELSWPTGRMTREYSLIIDPQ